MHFHWGYEIRFKNRRIIIIIKNLQVQLNKEIFRSKGLTTELSLQFEQIVSFDSLKPRRVTLRFKFYYWRCNKL